MENRPRRRKRQVEEARPETREAWAGQLDGCQFPPEYIGGVVTIVPSRGTHVRDASVRTILAAITALGSGSW